MRDALDTLSLRSAINDLGLNLFKNSVVLQTTHSTNSYLLQLEKEGAPHGTFVITHDQTAGRGRLDRAWLMEKGDIACSLLIRSPCMPKPPTLLALVPAVALVQALSNCGISSHIKWPNDVVVLNPDPNTHHDYFANYLKVGGLLIENVMRKGLLVASIIGIGINISLSPGKKLLIGHRGALKELKPEIKRQAVLMELLKTLDHHIGEFSSMDYQKKLCDAYQKKCVSLGKSLTFEHQGKAVRGVGHSITPEGALCIENGGNLQTIFAGDVNFCT
ncbi:MAG: biotin--[acetyl-CoA-carboxylase] ligase [Myxococcales bacterium]|nr:biotin--[acetyl-CoA-carboxylase] ligase [Myxococcales bacterium]USN50353.1 MAG: biotin--[acetyl-CoA-carboxylase] ligase [Myxococcales bacterium]